MRKKDELTRISVPIFQRVDQAYRRLEQVHGRQGGALQLVDLAGADFDDRDLGSSTDSTTAQQRKESIDINKSLLALKECFRFVGNKNFCKKIKKFFFRSVGTKGSKAPRACFRGSKLTRLERFEIFRSL